MVRFINIVFVKTRGVMTGFSMLEWKLTFPLLTCSVRSDCGSGSGEWSTRLHKKLIWFHTVSPFSSTFLVSFQALTLHWCELEQDMKAKPEFVHYGLYSASPSVYYFYCCISCHVEQTLCWFSEIFLKLWDSICLVRKVIVFRFYCLFLCFFFKLNQFWVLTSWHLCFVIQLPFFSSFSFLPSHFCFKLPKEIKIE